MVYLVHQVSLVSFFWGQSEEQEQGTYGGTAQVELSFSKLFTKMT